MIYVIMTKQNIVYTFVGYAISMIAYINFYRKPQQLNFSVVGFFYGIG